MIPVITAFAASPDRGRGLARDMAVRWALEEAGVDYDVSLRSFPELKQPEHLAHQPFGQIPTYQDGKVDLFESGAIVLHIAEIHGVLLPADARGRGRAIAWAFATKSTVEPVIVEREAAILFEKDKDWFQARMPILDERVRVRLGQLSQHLGDSEWLDGEFTAGDLLMVNVLRRPAAVDTVAALPNLAAYVARGEARPAFKRAFEAQHEIFLQSSAGAAQ